jgi:signal transduction histidine kinase
MRLTLLRDGVRVIVRQRDLLIGVVVAGLLFAEYVTDPTLHTADLVVGFAVSVGIGTLVTVRHRAPLALLGATTVLITLRAFIPPGGDGVAWGIVSLLAIYTVASERDGWEARIGMALTVVLAGSILVYDDGTWNFGDILFFGVLGATPWAFGRAIRHRREREQLLEEKAVILERDREQEMRQAVEDERARIARELHDVVAHSISVMVLQARGGRRVLDSDPADARDAFAVIEWTGQQALDEMRRLVGMLRSGDETLPLAPQPSLRELGTLVEQVRAAGLPVQLTIEGERRDLPPGVDLSAFRIVQEALTNALKHAGPASAQVVLRYRADDLEVEISDDGRGTGVGPSSGYGLVGMRERVSVYGGELQAGSRPGGGYALRVRLPLGAARA